MKLDKLTNACTEEEVVENYLHLERNVNSGSPSGFTTAHQVSPPYRPCNTKSFEAPLFKISVDEAEIFESSPGQSIRNSILETSGMVAFCIHPDVFNYYNCPPPESKLTVSPTASSRTVLATPYASSPFFVKLHYHRLIGRVTRHLSSKRLRGANLISQELKTLIDNCKLNDVFAFLPESLNVSTDAFGEQLGVTYRDFEPYPEVNDRRYIVPVFSLFGVDKTARDDLSLLTQLLKKKEDPVEGLVKIIKILVEAFRTVVEDGGLWPENHAQNILLEIDEDLEPRRVIHRDLYEFYPDIQFRSDLGLDSSSFEKTLDADRDGDLYYKQKSFLFDFKFGEYVIRPIVRDFCSNFNYNENTINEIIREIVSTSSDIWRTVFNPYDKYYYFPQVEKTYINGKPALLEGDNPTYR